MFKPQNILNHIEKIFMVISTVTLMALMVFTTAEALLRKILNFTIPSLYEFTSDYLMPTLVFLSLSYVYAIGGHIRVTLFLGLIPKGFLAVLDRLLAIAAMVFFVLMTVKGVGVVIRAIERGEVSQGLIHYPMAPAFALVPLGAGMLAIRLLQDATAPESLKELRENTEEVYVE